MTTASATELGLPLLPQYQDVKVVQRARDYLVNGVSYRRVSTALGIINKPALKKYFIRTTLERVEEQLMNPEVNAGPLSTLTEPSADADADYRGWVERLIADARKAADNQRDAAAERGTSIHEEIAALLAVPWEQRSSRPEVNRALDFITEGDFRVEGVEIPLWDDDLQIAGTCDVVARDKAGRRIIWDWKTGSGPWWEMALQLGAYAEMVGRVTGERPEEAYVIKLSEERSKKHRVDDLSAAWEAFVGAALLQHASNRKWWKA